MKNYTIYVLPGVNCFKHWLQLQTGHETVASLSVDDIGAGVASLEHLAGYFHQDESLYSCVVVQG